MNEILEMMNLIGSMTPERLLVILALAAVGLSWFAIYVVHAATKSRGRDSE